MERHSVRRLTRTRIPTTDGEFALSLYENSKDDKDHLALVCGDVEGQSEVLVRVHSECFTGDVLGSLRCDCGEQLDTSMRRVAEEGQGIVVYLRQEGRGIGLLNKLRAYNLQDDGYDTVEANRMLGHGADERDYEIAARILDNLGVSSARLLTNNPEKVEDLSEHGIDIADRVPMKPHVNRHNEDYLRTKADRMRHLLDLGPANGHTQSNAHHHSLRSLEQRMGRHFSEHQTPFVTLTYAQSLDGSIAPRSGTPSSISREEALDFPHRLRALHDGILVGIGTVLTGDPRLHAQCGRDDSPIPIVLDSSLRFPLDARLLDCQGPGPLIFTGPDAETSRRRALESTGATVVQLPFSPSGRVCLDDVLDALGKRQIESVMVEAGTEVLTSFLRQQQVQHVILAIAPTFTGGTPALDAITPTGDSGVLKGTDGFPRLTNVQRRWHGEDIILEGDPVWSDPM